MGMRWLRAIPFLVLLAWVESAPGCSGDDNTGPGEIAEAGQPPATTFEAGSSCASSDDCDHGLVCLFPVSTCNALTICVAPPGGSDGGGCAAPQYACSCLGEPIQVCGGYAANPVDTTSTCEGGILPIDSGAADSGASEAGASEGGADATAPAEAGVDGAASGDATTDAALPATDASDAAGE